MPEEFMIPKPELPTPEQMEAFYQKKLQKDSPTRLSYWFPKLLEAGLPVPKTILVEATRAEQTNACMICGDDVEIKEVRNLELRIQEAADQIGWPFFLRTDFTSGKHRWEDACYVANSATLLQNILGIVEFSECADMIGLPYDIWAVRELLPTRHYGVCKRYGNMPLTKEFRCFVDGGTLECWHPYWPPKSMEQGRAEFYKGFIYEDLCSFDIAIESNVKHLATAAGDVLGGRWSVDLLETENGWYITDLAEADKSYHWEGCKGPWYKQNER